MAPCTVVPGADHGDSGLAQEVIGRPSPGVGDRDADRGADEPVSTVERKRRLESRLYPRGDPVRVVHADERVDDDREFAAADAGDRVSRSELADKPLPDGPQQPIASGVTEGFVDDVEPVKVEQHHGDRVRLRRSEFGQGAGDPIGQQLSVRQPGDPVVQGAPMGDVDKAGVVQGDGSQRGEAGQGVDVALAPTTARVSAAQPEDTDDLATGLQRDTDDGSEQARRHTRGSTRPGVVVFDHQDLAATHHGARKPLAGCEAVPEKPLEHAAPKSDLEVGVLGVHEVDVAMRRAQQCGRAGHDGREQTGLVALAEQGQRGLVEGAQIWIGERAVGTAAVGRLDEIQRAVGHADEIALGHAVGWVAGDAGTDGDRWAPGRGGAIPDGSADPPGDLVGNESVRAGQDRGELVATVAIHQVAVARRVDHRLSDLDQERVAGWMPHSVVEGLERIQVEHQDPEWAAIVDRLADVALEGPVVAQAGQRIVLGADADVAVGLGIRHGQRGLAGKQFRQLELVIAEVSLGFAHSADVERADDLAIDDQRDHDHGLRLEWGARNLH